MTAIKNLCYIASISLAFCLAHNAAAQSWVDTDLNGLWDDCNNWSGGCPSDAAGEVVIINPAPGPNCTILDTDVINVGGLSDDSTTYGTVYGPEFGATLNIYGSLNVNWTIAPVQNNPDPAARSYLNMYENSVLTTSGASVNMGDAWWWTGGPYVTMNMYDDSQYTSLGGAGLWLGGHLNIYDDASFYVNGYINMDTAESQSDGTRSIVLGGGTLTLPEGNINGGNSGSVSSWITRGVLRAYGKGGDSVDLNITDNGANTIVTPVPLGGDLQRVYFQPVLESSVYIGTFQQLVLVGDYPSVTGVYLSSSEPGVEPASFPTPSYTSSNPNVISVDANGIATAVGPGSATVTATVGSFTTPTPVTITVLRSPSLIHRYSFSESSGSTTADSITGSPSYAGELNGGATLGGGQVALDGQTGYVQLPAGILSGLDEVTIETWASFGNPINVYANLFCFGYSDQTGDPNDGLGGDYINVVPNSAGTTTQVSFGQGLPGFDDEWDAGIPNPLNGATNVQVVAVFHPFANSESLYINGVLVANNSMFNDLIDPVAFANPTVLAGDPPALTGGYNGGSYLAYTLGSHAILDEAGNETISDPDNFIGWDNYQGVVYGTPASGGTGDPTLNGSVDEFRIYNGPLSAAQIKADYLLGANQLIGSCTDVTLTAVQSGNNIVISWPTCSAYVTLVSSPLPGSGPWTPVTNGTLAIVGSNYQETVPITGTGLAFGLQ